MNKEEYLQGAAVERELHEFDQTTKRAEERSLAKLRRSGLRFKSIAEVRAFKRSADRARRARAEQISLTAEHTRRTT